MTLDRRDLLLGSLAAGTAPSAKTKDLP